MEILKLYTMENPVLRFFGFYAAFLALKLFAVVAVTIYYRFTRKVFMNPEDTTSLKNSKVGVHPDIERILRVHRNDLENIPAFWILGLLFVGTNPSLTCASFCYRLFAASRVIHSIVYIFKIPQPARALAFIVGLIINLYMAFKILSNF